MNLINLIFKDLTTQRALFHLSDFAFKTLKEYEKDGYIELEKFVEDSIKSYLNEYSDFAEKGSLDKLNTDRTRPIFLRISKILLIRLWWCSLKLKATQSEIINEALSYSMPHLISQVEATEDCSIELALKEN